VIGVPEHRADFEKTGGIVGLVGTDEITISWLPGELDGLTPGRTYDGQLWSTRTSDGKRREPYKFQVAVSGAVL
jgi:hypothetical protein